MKQVYCDKCTDNKLSESEIYTVNIHRLGSHVVEYELCEKHINEVIEMIEGK